MHFFVQAINMRKSSSITSSNGKMINLLSFDAYRFDTTISLVHHLWKGPIEVLVFGYFLYREIGFYGWIGVVFIMCFAPVQSKLHLLFSEIGLKWVAGKQFLA